MDSAGNVVAVNTFGANGLLTRRSGAQSSFYTFDQQGNVSQVQDASGNVTSTVLYDAYGSRLSANDSTPFGFGGQAGYYTDPETGLLLLTHRYYDPEEGRFLNRDPIGYAGGMNLYAYCGGNPVNFMDPDGENPLLIAGGIGLVVGGIAGGVNAWIHDENIWAGAGKGAVIGGIAGLTGGAVGGWVTAWVGGGIWGGVAGGAAGGLASDTAAQLCTMDWKRPQWDWTSTATSTGIGAFTGGIAARPSPARVSARVEVVKRHEHHPWPMFMGGPKVQPTVSMDPVDHIGAGSGFHSGLWRALGVHPPKPYTYFRNLSPLEQIEAFDALRVTSQAWDAQYGTNLWQIIKDIAGCE